MIRLIALILLAWIAGRSVAADPAHSGRMLYQGLQPFVAGDGATTTRLPVEMAACVRCHGARGEGGREGGVTAPALRWSALTQARDGLPAFESHAAVVRAIAQGQGRGGRTLNAVMPRFALREDETRALLEYLQRVGGADDVPAGVSANEIRLGVIAPLSGQAARTGVALVSGLRHAFAQANSRGGVHGRRIVLVEQDSAHGVAAALRGLKARSVYALVGGLWNEASARVEPQLAAAHLAHVATLVVREQAPSPLGWSADLLPPLAQQQSALTQSLSRCAGQSAVAIEQAGMTAVNGAAASSIQWLAADASLSGRLRGRAPGCVGYTLAQAGMVRPVVPAAWSQALVLPVPSALFDGAAREQSALWQRLGTLAAQLTLELLGRAGAGLHERSLLDQLDRLAGFELPAGVPLQFSRTRRYGWEPQVLQFSDAGGDASRATTLMKGD